MHTAPQGAVAHPSLQVDALGVQNESVNFGGWGRFKLSPSWVGAHPEEVALSHFVLFQFVSGFGSRKTTIKPEVWYTCGRDSLHVWYNGGRDSLYIWYTCGRDSLHIWYTGGRESLHIWYTDGRESLHIWYTGGRESLHIWYTC